MNSDIDTLIELFAKLPSLGKKSATRIVLHLLKKKEYLPRYVSAIENLQNKITECSICSNIDVINPCSICNDVKKDPSILCIVEEVEDLWALEKSNVFQGKYHILGGSLSAIKGIGPDDLNIHSLIKRLEGDEIKEVIIATNATMDGQTTAFYITDMIRDKVEKISKLAHGIPLGSELGYLDEGTLNAAFESRKNFDQ